MAMFVLQIAGAWAFALIAAAPFVFHYAKKESSTLLQISSLVLLVGGLVTGGCTLFYGIKYFTQGDFASAYPVHAGMMRGMPPMHGEMMRGMPMNQGQGSQPSEQDADPTAAGPHNHDGENAPPSGH